MPRGATSARWATASVAFDPSTVSGLLRWFKADGTLWQDSARTTAAAVDGDPVGSWDDAATPADHAKQSTSTKRPLLKTGANGINGLPVVRFDGVDDFLAGAVSVTLKPVTFFAVFKPTSFGTRTIVAATVGGAMQWRAVSTAKMDLLSQGTADIGGSTGTLAAATAALVTGSYDASGNWAHRINRAVSGSGLNNLTIPGSVVLVGSNNGTTEFMLGDIAELLIYSNLVSGTNVTSIESYLSSKWGTP